MFIGITQTGQLQFDPFRVGRDGYDLVWGGGSSVGVMDGVVDVG
jgi:hypothetical protein